MNEDTRWLLWVEESRMQAAALAQSEGLFHAYQAKLHDWAAKVSALALFPCGSAFGAALADGDRWAVGIPMLIFSLLMLVSVYLSFVARRRERGHLHVDPREFVDRRMMEWEYHQA